MKYIYISFSMLFWLLILSPKLSLGQDVYPSTGRVVVKYAQAVQVVKKKGIQKQIQGDMVASFQNEQIEIWELADERAFSDLKTIAAQNPDILFIEPDYIYQMALTPDDPYFDKQWGLNNSGQSGGSPEADIRVQTQWSLHTGNKDIVSGVIDTGIDWGHEDLVDNIWQNLAEDADGDGHTIEWIDGSWQLDPGDLNNVDEDENGYIDDLIGWDFVNDDNNPFDDNGHGTHVAGIMGAKGNNGKGVSGVSWTTQLMALKAFDDKGNGSVLSIVPALEYARMMGARLTNNSWGGPAYSQAIYDEIALANTAGILSIAAAGNNAANNSSVPIYPGSFDLANVICVAASNHQDSLAQFSNYSYDLVDLAAPGQDIFSTLPGNAYGYKSGTSMATPMISGAISLIWSLDTSLTYAQVRDLLLASADRKPGLTYQCVSGGRVNVLESMRVIRAFCETLDVTSAGHKSQGLLSDGEYIWAGTNHGIHRMNKKDCSATMFTTPDGLASNMNWTMAKAQNGDIWSASNGGINVYNGSSWSTYKTNNSGMPNNKAQCIYIDDSDIKWIGMQADGLVKFDGTDWTVYHTFNSGIAGDNIREIIEDNDGNLLLATQGGIAIFDKTNWSSYTPANSGLPDYNIYSITMDSLGNIWAGTNSLGLAKFDGTNWTTYNVSNSPLPHNRVNSVKVDQDGNIWVATNAGVAKFDGTNWLIYDSSDPIMGIPDDNVISLLVDEDNNVWAGTTAGVFLFSVDALVSSFTTSKAPCKSQTINFQNSSIGGKTFEWRVDGVTVSTNQNLSYSFSTAGTHEVALVAHNLYANDTLFQSYTVADLPSLDLGPDTTACAAVVVLDPSVSHGSFVWTDLTGTVLSTQKQYQATQNGSYILTVNTVCETTVKDTIVVSLSGDCVWAGDVNADGKVNMLDYLALGIANGVSGSARSGATTNWQSETASDWSDSFHSTHAYAANINYKHADCNGDGVIDILTDGAVVMQNAGFSHEAIEVAGPNAVNLIVEPTLTTMTASDTFTISYDIHLSSPNGGAVEGVYGLAFTLDYNLPLSQAPEIEIDAAFAGDLQGAVITYDENNAATGSQVNAFRRRMAIGMVSTDQTNQSVSTRIGRANVIVVLEDIQEGEGVMDFISLSITPNNLVIIDSVGKAQAVNNQSSSATSTVLINYPNETLPVEWLDFSAVKKGNQVGLSWLTAGESGKEKYIVQRSDKQRNFVTLGQISSKETAEGSYQFTDFLPVAGDNYYRIVSIDVDGTSHVSAVEMVHMEAQAFSFTIFPNPSSGNMDVRIQSNHSDLLKMKVINTLGKSFISQEIKVEQGTQDIPLDLSRYPSGIYYLEIANESRKEVFKIVYQKK